MITQDQLYNEARVFLAVSDDRRNIELQLPDGTRVAIDSKSTLPECKAQYADLLWILSRVLRRGIELGTTSNGVNDCDGIAEQIAKPKPSNG